MSEQGKEFDDAVRARVKRELRGRMRQLRRALPTSAIAARSRAIIDRVVLLDAWSKAHTIGLFMSLPDEVQLGELIRIAREQGRRVALPVVTGARALTFRAPFDGGVDRGLFTSSFGIAEPGEDSPEVALEDLDLVVVPALAIDPRGHRLGYGAGYYDSTLPRATKAERVGVAFEFQLIMEVPVNATDAPVDWIVTDTRSQHAEP